MHIHHVIISNHTYQKDHFKTNKMKNPAQNFLQFKIYMCTMNKNKGEIDYWRILRFFCKFFIRKIFCVHLAFSFLFSCLSCNSRFLHQNMDYSAYYIIAEMPTKILCIIKAQNTCFLTILRGQTEGE